MVRRALILVLAAAAAAMAQAPPQPRITQAVNDRQVVRLPGNTIRLARPAYDRGAAAPELALDHMLLVLRRSPRQQADLSQFLDELRENDSPQYHQWLTPAQFGARFGPAPADVATVTAWLAGAGFHVDSVAAGGGTIEFSGTAAGVAAAFHTQMHRYQVNGVMHLANAIDPSIPEALAPVVAGVVSLNDFESHPQSHIVAQGTWRPGQTQPGLNYTGSNGQIQHALVPGDLAMIYGLGSNPPTGQGETIALVARSDVNSGDVSQFRSLFQAGAAGQVQTIQVATDPGIATDGDQDEATLDAEWAGALAPGANIDLVVAATTSTTDGVDLAAQYIVDHDLAPVMSTSFVQCEALFGAAENTFWSNLWEQAAAEGITALVSSGDNGSAGCDDQSNGQLASLGLAVNGIASTPYDTAVGGTEFNEGAGGGTYWSTSTTSAVTALGYIPESAWNESSPTAGQISLWAGSGGASGVYPKPPWQAGTGVPQDKARDLPDISLTAAEHDGYVMCIENSCTPYNGAIGFAVVSGTSAASPAWAGIMALVDQQQAGPVGLANPALYQLAAQAGSVFHDVSSGSNAVPCAANSPNCGANGLLTGYSATTGFDLATGWGSPNIANLLPQWSTVKFAASTTSLQLTLPQNLTYGQSVPLAIQVTPATSGPTPTGAVVLLAIQADASETEIQTDPLDASGNVNAGSAVLPAGNYKVVARYSGDTNYGASTSAPVPVNVAQTSPAVLIQLTAMDPRGAPVPIAEASFGDTVAAKVVVSVPGQTSAPSGTVQIVSTVPGATPFDSGPVRLDGSGTATFTDQAPQDAGTFSFVARYSGDDNDIAATSATTTLTIAKASTSLQITGVTANGVSITLRTGNGYLPQDPYNFAVNVSAGGKTVTFQTSYTSATDPATGLPELDIMATFSTPVPGTSATYVAQTNGFFNYLPSTSAAFSGPTPPDLTFVPATLVFDPVAIGASSTKSLVLTNSGGMAAALQLNTNDRAFAATDDCGGSLAMGASCNVQITFTPYAGTTFYGGGLITEQPGAAVLALSGASEGFSVTAVPNFSPMGPNQPASFQLKLAPINGLAGPVTLGCSGLPDFTACSFSPVSPTLDGAATIADTLTVTYTPAASEVPPPARGPGIPLGLILVGCAGLLSAMLVPAARPARPFLWLGCLVALSACGGGGGGGGASVPPSGGDSTSPPPAQATVQVTPGSIDFGQVQVGQSSPTQNFTVVNTGAATLKINALGVIAGTGQGYDFRQTNSCATDLAAGAQCVVGLQFVPSAAVAESGTFEVVDSASDSPQTATVVGTGVHTELASGSYWFTVTARAGGQSQQLPLVLTVP